MIDASNDELLAKNLKNNHFSFDSISEKNEESSSSVKNSKMTKSRVTLKNNNKSIMKSNNDISKDGINVSNISITKTKRPTSKNSILAQKRKTIRIFTKEDMNTVNSKKNYIRRETKKKTTQFKNKRTSFQHDYGNMFYNHLNESKRNSSSKNVEPFENNVKKFFYREQSLNASMNKMNNLSVLTSLINNNKNSIVEKMLQKNKNTTLSNSEYLDQKYFHTKKKNTVLNKNKFNLKNQRNMNFSNLFEKLRDSYLFEKSEIVLFKIKICYGFLAVFSFLSILMELIDVIIFNKESENFVKENYNITLVNDTNINNYYFIEKRKLSKRENNIRLFNIFFSIISFALHLFIHFIKNNYDKETKKKKKKSYYKHYNRKRRTTRSSAKETSNTISDNRIKIITNDDFVTKNFVTREEIIKLVINCVISLVFYPPGVNKVFIGYQNNIIYVYSLNSIFLLITFFKLSNIYFAIYYLSPFNNLLYKTICSSNMIKLDFKFMFRFLLNLYPIYFILINFITIGLVISILLYSFEYFSINVNGIWNNKGANDLKNFYNEMYLYLSFIIKSVNGNIKPETILGNLVMFIGGTIGLIINSYLIYYLSQLTEFKPEEQQAYTKLIKLLNPINNEHKASNFIKIFLLMKKMYIDNRNIEKEYRTKKENDFKGMVEKNLGMRKSGFNLALNESENSLSNIRTNNEYKEKKKLIKYISTEFILKVKLINECKNFRNILLIARNYSLSFNDVLKTLEDKMNGNLNQLNNKLEVLIQNDQKFKNFMRFQENSIKKLKKIMIYQDFLLNYLIGINNETSVEYLRETKEMQNNFKNKLKNVGQGGPRRLKSLINGSIFTFTKKPTRKASKEDEEDKKNNNNNNNKDNKNLKVLFDNQKKFGFKRLKSSVVGNKGNFRNINDLTKSRTIPIKKIFSKRIRKKSKSIDNTLLNNYKKNDILDKIQKEEYEKIRKERKSLSGKQKEILDKWRNNIEKK